MNTIKTEIAKTNQNVTYNELCDAFSHHLKITIRSNAYDFQSYARIYVLQDNKWELLDEIHFSYMKTPHELRYYPKTITESVFNSDRQKLLDVAEKLLTKHTQQ